MVLSGTYSPNVSWFATRSECSHGCDQVEAWGNQKSHDMSRLFNRQGDLGQKGTQIVFPY